MAKPIVPKDSSVKNTANANNPKPKKLGDLNFIEKRVDHLRKCLETSRKLTIEIADLKCLLIYYPSMTLDVLSQDQCVKKVISLSYKLSKMLDGHGLDDNEEDV